MSAGPHSPTTAGDGPLASRIHAIYQAESLYPEFVVTYAKAFESSARATSSKEKEVLRSPRCSAAAGAITLAGAMRTGAQPVRADVGERGVT